jgi:hypothetical protein
MTTLATLTTQLEAICDQIEDSDTLPDDLLERFADARLSHMSKIDNYVSLLSTIKSNAEYYETRAKQLQRRAKTCARIEAAVKERLLIQVMTHPNLPWASSEGDKLRAQKSPEALEIDLPNKSRTFSHVVDSLPDDFNPRYADHVTCTVLNTERIRTELAGGIDIPWARLVKRSHLRVY